MRSISAGASMLAITSSLPPQRRQRSISIAADKLQALELLAAPQKAA